MNQNIPNEKLKLLENRKKSKTHITTVTQLHLNNKKVQYLQQMKHLNLCPLEINQMKLNQVITK